MKNTIATFVVLALVLTLTLATGCAQEEIPAWRQFNEATSHVEVVETPHLASFKELVKEALAAEGIEALEISVSTGWSNSGWNIGQYAVVHVYTADDEYLRYSVGNISGPMVAALEGDGGLEMLQAYLIDDFSFWEAEVRGDEIVLTGPVIPALEEPSYE